MTCDCHDTAAQHDADFQAGRVTYLPQYEAEKRLGMAYHCPECVREARGEYAAESCRLCPPGRHRDCEFHEQENGPARTGPTSKGEVT